MALSDIVAQSGEGQDFILEIPTVVYAGSATDILIESGGSQFLLLETPLVTGGGGGNIFIMSE